MLSKNEKVDLLKGILKGERTIQEISDPRLMMFYQVEPEIDKYVDWNKYGEIVNGTGNPELLTRKDIDSYKAKHKHTQVIVLQQQAGCEPLTDNINYN